MKNIGFIGAGNMAEALLKGVLQTGTFPKKNIILSDINLDRLKNIKNNYGVRTTQNNKEVVASSEIVVLAVKPGNIEAILKEIKNDASIKKIYISIAAGIKTSFIRKCINKNIKIARVMPNTPALVLEGASGIFFNEFITDEDKKNIVEIFNSLGRVEIINSEDLIDAVTGLSGSGPAFSAIFIEALTDGGVKMGLSRPIALKLAAQTVLGTAKMILETDIKPSELKDNVSSPGGTTINGIHELEKLNFRDATISAVEAATFRSIELSREEDEIS